MMTRPPAVLALVIAASALGPVALAQGGPPKLCIYASGTPMPGTTPSSVPIFTITAFAESSNDSSATNDARNKWASKARQDFGQAYGNISRARFLVVSCQNTGTPFVVKKRCTVTAQPCN